MTSLAKREKLVEYIRTAEDKKIKAIFIMVEDDIETYKWWKDEGLIKQFNKEYADYESGKDKAFSIEEVRAHFEKKGNKK